MPFEIPSSWVWTNVASFTYDLQYGTSEKSSSEGSVPVLRMGNITRIGSIDYSDLVYSSNEEDIRKYELKKNDILFNRTNSSEWVGKTAIFKSETPTIYAGYLIRLRCIFLSPDYINLVMNSSYHRDWCNQVKTDAVNQSNINAQKLSNLLIPIPPYSEQLRIVSEVERWLALIEQIEGRKVELESVIKRTKNKILDLAIHGKLVPQDPNDEPASELLKCINPKAEITCDNGQYGKLPQNWCLTIGSSIFKPMKSIKPAGDSFKYIDIDSIDNKSNIVGLIKNIPTIEAPSRASRYTEKGDVVFSMVRPYLRNIAQINESNCIASTGFYICSPYECMHQRFCYYLMLSNYVVNGLNEFMKGDNSPSITKGNVDNWLFPIPPLAEQKRIVDAIDKTFAKLDTIMESL